MCHGREGRRIQDVLLLKPSKYLDTSGCRETADCICTTLNNSTRRRELVKKSLQPSFHFSPLLRFPWESPTFPPSSLHIPWTTETASTMTHNWNLRSIQSYTVSKHIYNMFIRLAKRPNQVCGKQRFTAVYKSSLNSGTLTVSIYSSSL